MKYNTQSTDFTALQRELGHPAEPGYDKSEDGGDPYADDGLEDDESWVGGQR